jgi:hypothetical protein
MVASFEQIFRRWVGKKKTTKEEEDVTYMRI